METTFLCAQKVVAIRKELAESIKSTPTIDTPERFILNTIRKKMDEYEIMLESTLVALKSEMVIEQMDDSPFSLPRQKVTMTQAYTVIDADSHDIYGPAYITTTTLDDLKEISLSYEMNEWAAMLQIFIRRG